MVHLKNFIKLHHKLKSQEIVTLSKQNLTTQDQRLMTAKGYNDEEGSGVAVQGRSATW